MGNKELSLAMMKSVLIIFLVFCIVFFVLLAMMRSVLVIFLVFCVVFVCLACYDEVRVGHHFNFLCCVLLFCLSSLCVFCPMLPVSLD
jgi:glucan phosphoethanolaminetransferase (alkaline phosphatase superfamily)